MSGRHMYAASGEDVAEEAVRRVDAEGDKHRQAEANERMREERQAAAQVRMMEEGRTDAIYLHEDRPSEEELQNPGVGRFSITQINDAQKIARAWCRRHAGTDDREDRGLRATREESRAEEEDQDEEPEDLWADDAAWEELPEADGRKPLRPTVDLAVDTPEQFAEHVENMKLICTILDVYRNRYSRMRLQAKSSQRLLESFGFKYLRENTWTTPRTDCCPSCGHRAMLQEVILEKGKWLVICPECMTRSVEESGPMHAVKAWNERRLTEESEMLLYVGKRRAMGPRRRMQEGGAAE